MTGNLSKIKLTKLEKIINIIIISRNVRIDWLCPRRLGLWTLMSTHSSWVQEWIFDFKVPQQQQQHSSTIAAAATTTTVTCHQQFSHFELKLFKCNNFVTCECRKSFFRNRNPHFSQVNNCYYFEFELFYDWAKIETVCACVCVLVYAWVCVRVCVNRKTRIAFGQSTFREPFWRWDDEVRKRMNFP